MPVKGRVRFQINTIDEIWHRDAEGWRCEILWALQPNIGQRVTRGGNGCRRKSWFWQEEGEKNAVKQWKPRRQEDRMQTECFEGKDDGGESKRILRSPGITPDGCTSAVKVGVKYSKWKKTQEDGAALKDTGCPAVLSYAEHRQHHVQDGSMQSRDVGLDNEVQ